METITLATGSKNPLVSIVCLTYNQEKFIAQAIDSFVAQLASFPFEIIIHDDASTDGTLTIVKDYQARYPDLITVVCQTVNIYSKGVRVPARVFEHVRGQFIAYCEGDDYWCDSKKIQKQADIMLNNSRCGAVFTNKNIFFQETGKMVLGNTAISDKRLAGGNVRASLLVTNPYATCTSMFRKEAVSGYESIAKKLDAKLDDYVMWLYIAAKYEIEYIRDVTATYRVSLVSASHSPHLAVKIRFYKSAYKIACHFNTQFGSLVDKQLLKNRYKTVLIEYCLSNGYVRNSFRYSKPLGAYLMCVLRVVMRKVLGRT